MAKSRNTARAEADMDSGYSNDTVAKVGRALGQVVTIQQIYTQEVQSVGTDDEKERLTSQAEQSAVQAIQQQGLSISEYNAVVTAADTDPDLEQRVLAAVPTEG
ncbi:MAG TPA: DUF4168 domain-containing protein [Acetobacteraceae bacterium]|jgi:hypothetical protein